MNLFVNRNKLRTFLLLILLSLVTFIIGESTNDRKVNLLLLIVTLLVFCGIIYLSRDLLREIKDKYGEFALKTSKEFLQKLSSVILFIYGCYLTLSIISLNYFENIESYSQNMAIKSIIIVSIDLILGFVFILLSKLLFDKQKKAIKLLTPIGVFSVFYLIITGERFTSVLPLLLVILLSNYTKEILDKERFIYSWEEMSIDLITTVVIGFFYIVNIKNNEYSGIIKIYRWIYLIMILAVLFVVAKVILSYMKHGGTLENNTDLNELDTLIEKYGSSQSLASGLAFLGDKYLYFYEDKNKEKTVAFQYGIINNKAIVMGEPFGKDQDIADALYDFNTTCTKSGLNPIFYEVGERFTLNLHDYGYDFMKFGENALVDLEAFSLAGRKKSTERNILNRFSKDGYQFKVVSPPYLDEFLDKLGEISNSWLNGRDEKGFSLGFFDKTYLGKSDIALVIDKDGMITAFANIIPDKNREVLSIDLMRYDLAKNVNSMMDYLFLNLYIYGKDKGYKYFNLGMAPLANVGINKSAYLSERMAYIVYKHANSIYSFKGLRNYKQKYATIWDPKYIVYAKGNWLLYALIALGLIDKRNSKKD